MAKKNIGDYEHVQVEVTGFPKEAKKLQKVTVKQRICSELERKGKMRYMQIMHFIGHGGYTSMILNDMLKDGTVTKKKYNCGTCEYFELVKKKK